MKSDLCYKIKADCWIQITLEESTKLKREEIISVGIKYLYADESQNEMAKYQIVICHLFQDGMKESSKIESNLSIRLANEERIIVVWALIQYSGNFLLTQAKCGYGQIEQEKERGRQRAISPKDEGQGGMVRAFQSTQRVEASPSVVVEFKFEKKQ